MPTDITAILICFIASLIGLTVKGNKPFIYFFPVLLLVTFIVEYLSWKLSIQGIYNVEIYNIYSLVEFGFYLFFLQSLIKEFYKSNTITYLIIAYLLITLINMLFIQKLDKFHTYTYMLGCLFIVTLCIFYFNLLFRFTRSNKLWRDPEFWIVIGCLFSFAITLPLFGITNFVIGIPEHLQNILQQIINCVNIMLYLLFTIGFLCRVNIRKLSL